MGHGVGEEESGFLEPKDYTNYLLFVVLYVTILICMYMFFFKTELRRTNANNIRLDIFSIVEATLNTGQFLVHVTIGTTIFRIYLSTLLW